MGSPFARSVRGVAGRWACQRPYRGGLTVPLAETGCQEDGGTVEAVVQHGHAGVRDAGTALKVVTGELLATLHCHDLPA